MKFSKKIFFAALTFVVLLTSMFLSACSLENADLMKQFVGKYTYESCIDTMHEKVERDFAAGGNFTLTIRDNKAIFNNLSAENDLGFIFTLDAMVHGNTLKFHGRGYYYDEIDNDGTIIKITKEADYVFGSATKKDGKIVVKLMFVEYATVSENTSLKCAVEITFA